MLGVLLHEAVEHLLPPGLLEINGELVALDRIDLAVAEFQVEDAFADPVGGAAAVVGGAGDEFALDGQRPRAAAAAVAGLLPGAFPARRLVQRLERVVGVVAGAAAAAIAVAAVSGAGILDLHHFRRQFVDEARGDRRLPEAAVPPILREADAQALARAGQADIGEAAL